MVRLPVSRDTLVFFPLPLIALEKMPGFVTHARWVSGASSSRKRTDCGQAASKAMCLRLNHSCAARASRAQLAESRRLGDTAGSTGPF